MQLIRGGRKEGMEGEKEREKGKGKKGKRRGEDEWGEERSAEGRKRREGKGGRGRDGKGKGSGGREGRGEKGGKLNSFCKVERPKAGHGLYMIHVSLSYLTACTLNVNKVLSSLVSLPLIRQ